MTSLTDVYDGRAGTVASPRRQLTGAGLFVAGAAMVVAAIALVTTDAGIDAFGLYQVREYGGILAGLGLPAVLLGVFTVLPASRRVRAAAVVGASIAVLGVALFTHAYPWHWLAADPLLALGTSVVYLAGILTTFWCLFLALATFKTRRDPGGTARMRITESGTIRMVQAARKRPSFGGIGMFGGDPDGDVETQTNREDAASTGEEGAEVLTEPMGDGGRPRSADPLTDASGSTAAGSGDATGLTGDDVSAESTNTSSRSRDSTPTETGPDPTRRTRSSSDGSLGEGIDRIGAADSRDGSTGTSTGPYSNAGTAATDGSRRGSPTRSDNAAESAGASDAIPGSPPVEGVSAGPPDASATPSDDRRPADAMGTAETDGPGSGATSASRSAPAAADATAASDEASTIGSTDDTTLGESHPAIDDPVAAAQGFGVATADTAEGVDQSPPGDEAIADAVAEDAGGDYCGDCTHFEYVKKDGEPTPYCGYYTQVLEDMDGCEHWTEQSY